MKGNIHSFETFGTKDGPGIRFVLFMQGCPLRCLYCHNVDTWKMKNAKYQLSVDEVVKKITDIKSFIKTGGVTISGGEALLQNDFVNEVFKRCKENNIHTALDTSGYIINESVKKTLESVDLVLLDIKHINKEKHKNLTGVELDNTLEFLNYLATINKKVWIRYVLIPQYTDSTDDIEELAKYLSLFSNIEKVEVLPFHQMGQEKWEKENIVYKLKEIPTPSREEVQKAENIFKKYNLNI